MKLKYFLEMLLLAIFLHLKAKKNKKMTKELSFKTAQGFLMCMLTLRPQMPHICGFKECFSFSHFLASSSWILNLRPISLNCKLNFASKKLDFCRLDVLLQSKPVQRNWLCFFKNFEEQCAF